MTKELIEEAKWRGLQAPFSDRPDTGLECLRDDEVLAAAADALAVERGHMQSLAKWVGVPDDTPSLEIACEASAALETLAARQPTEDDQEAIAKQLRSIGAVKSGKPAFYKDDPEERVDAPLSAVLDLLVPRAARQPSEDDREALRKEFEYRIRTAVTYGSGLGFKDRPVQERADWIQREIRNAVEQVTRAAVPDAATELERERKLGAARQRFVFETGQHNERLLSERDAALAAVERVRAETTSVLMAETDPPNDWNLALDYLAKKVLAALDGAPEPDVRDEFPETVAFIRENSESLGLPDRALQREVSTRREMTSPAYVLRGGVYLQDEHAGVLIDSVGNFSAKTKGSPRSLAVLLKAIAEDIDDDVALLPVEGERK